MRLTESFTPGQRRLIGLIGHVDPPTSDDQPGQAAILVEASLTYPARDRSIGLAAYHRRAAAAAASDIEGLVSAFELLSRRVPALADRADRINPCPVAHIQPYQVKAWRTFMAKRLAAYVIPDWSGQIDPLGNRRLRHGEREGCCHRADPRGDGGLTVQAHHVLFSIANEADQRRVSAMTAITPNSPARIMCALRCSG